MIRLITLCCATICLCITSLSLNAQKYGYLNSGNLLETLPKVEAANKKLGEYQQAQLAERDTKLKALETKFNAYREKANSGDLSPVQIQEREKELQVEQQQIAQLEQKIAAEIQKMRQELFDPILKEVDEAIRAVGKSNNYMMIFDTSLPNAILFSDEAENVAPLVRKQLGLG